MSPGYWSRVRRWAMLLTPAAALLLFVGFVIGLDLSVGLVVIPIEVVFFCFFVAALAPAPFDNRTDE